RLVGRGRGPAVVRYAAEGPHAGDLAVARDGHLHGWQEPVADLALGAGVECVELRGIYPDVCGQFGEEVRCGHAGSLTRNVPRREDWLRRGRASPRPRPTTRARPS